MNRSGLIALLAIIVLGAGGYYFYSQSQKSGEATPTATTDAPVAAVADGGESEPLLFTFEDWTNEAFLAEYKEKYGKAPRTALWADEDEAFAKMRAGYKPDVMGPCSYEFGRWQEAGLLQPIDVTKLKHWKDIPDYLKNIPGMMKSETEAWFVPQYWANTSVTYRTDLAPEYVGKESWKILFDPKYKGRIAGLDGVDDTVTLIAKTWGIDPYNMTPEQWTTLQGKLREFVAAARFISSDETSLSQGLASGEIVAAVTWNQTPAALKKEGKPVAYMNPPGGMFTYVCGLVVHAESKDLEKAYALIDSSIAPGAMKYQFDELSNGPANMSIFADYTDEQLAEKGFVRDVKAFLESGTFQQRLKNKDEIVKFWTEIRGGG
jgi:spermidine/putrescine transport system substrate-binding protein